MDKDTTAHSKGDESVDGANSGCQVVNRRKRTFEGIKGTQKGESGLKGVSESFDIYIGRCSPHTSVDNINNFVNDVLKVPTIGCVSISGNESKVKAFKLTVSAEDREKLLDASIWPENIRVRKYFYSRFNARKQ